MATVKILAPREQESHFGLYRTSAGGDESIFVRRKVGEPTDYEHNSSRKLKRQREVLSVASQHYASLSPSQKAATRHQFEEVEFIRSHGKTDIKLLTGRQLFISKEIRSLRGLGQQLLVPTDLCLFTCDANEELLVPGNIYAILWNELQSWRHPTPLSPGFYLWKALDPTRESYQVKATRTGWNDYQTAKLPLKEFQNLRYCIIHPGLAVIEQQPSYKLTYAGEPNLTYIYGERAVEGLHYHFQSAIPGEIPFWLAVLTHSITMKEVLPSAWTATISIPNSAYAARLEPGIFWHDFSIYVWHSWALVQIWRIISGESCTAKDGSPPGTYDYLIYPDRLTYTTLP